MNRAQRRAAAHRREPMLFDASCITLFEEGSMTWVMVGLGNEGGLPEALTGMCPHAALEMADELREVAEAVLRHHPDGCDCGGHGG